MTFLTEESMRQRAREWVQRAGQSADELLKRQSTQSLTRYNVFLSQTARDAEIVLGVYSFLVEKGLTVFCDWITARNETGAQVTPANAETIRSAMSVSDTLLFIDTEQAEQSRWMCWELGWFDGGKGLVGVLPVLPEAKRSYRGREFLGLYPYIELNEVGELMVVRPIVTNSRGITIIESPNSTGFDHWRAGQSVSMRPRNF